MSTQGDEELNQGKETPRDSHSDNVTSVSNIRPPGSHTSTVSSETIIMKQKAKAEAARANLEFVHKENELERQRFELENSMKILKAQKEAVIADAELKAMIDDVDLNKEDNDDHQGSKQLYTEQYVTQQNEFRNVNIGSNLRPNADHFVPGAFNADVAQNGSPHQGLHFQSNQPTGISCPGIPSDPYYDPRYHHNIGIPDGATDLTRFLLKKDLLLQRLTSFNDQPDKYPVWKASFRNIAQDLKVGTSEKLDLLVKYLGPESSKHALNIRAAYVNDPNKALIRVWERLEERYGAPEMIESTLKRRLTTFPRLGNKDYKKLFELSDLAAEIAALKENPIYAALLAYFDTSSGVNQIVAKLPHFLQRKWMDRAMKYKIQNRIPFPPFTVFMQFLREISSLYNDPSFALDSKYSESDNQRDQRSMRQRKDTISARKTGISSETGSIIEVCPLHKTKHVLNQCKGFRKMTIENRKKFLRDNKICMKCCEQDHHDFRLCRRAVLCAICKSTRHATALHPYDHRKDTDTENRPVVNHGEETSPKEAIESKCTAVCGNGFTGRSCSKTVLIDIYKKDNPNDIKRIYAIIDDQSNRTLARTELLDAIDITGNKTRYLLSTCSGKIQRSGRQAYNLIVRSADGSNLIELPTVIECNELPNDRSEIPTPEVAQNFAHLKQISREIPPLDNTAEIQLLIGRDVIEAHHVLDQILGPRETPFAQRLRLGWVIVGDVCIGKSHKPATINVNKTLITKEGRGTLFEPCASKITLKEQFNAAKACTDLKIDLEKHDLFQRSEDDDKIGLSADDREFLQIMRREMKKGENGNWEAPLPFRPSRQTLPNNRSQARRRALILQSNLRKNPSKQRHFFTFMEKIINSGAAEVAPKKPNSECWYLPIFGVYNKKKSNEIRGVFDSSIVYEGQSLNQALLSGPNMANSLLGVLLRFRTGQYAMTADIERMFYSFYVREDHRDFLRFFWYANNDPNSSLIEYRMHVHVFGNTPSPAVATYGLRKTVANSSQDVKDYVTWNFYVDDALVSLPTAEEAISLMKRTQKDLMDGGNIRLHKIASNRREIMDAFPEEDLAKNLRLQSLDFDDLPTQQSLGIAWDLTSDSFTINLSLEDKPFTKRGLLSTINSIFDPMGFVAPVVIRGRILLREIMTDGLTWDEPLPQDRKLEWESWKESLSALKNIKVPRMFVPVSLTSETRHEVHIFSDASEKAVSAVAYLRVLDGQNKPNVGFIMGKSKLAPTKGHTIPRLELCAAVLASEIGETIIDQLGIPRSNIAYHTDSKVVLGYIHNKSRRFYTYVSNRVATIHKRSSPEQWHYVQTHLNPADEGTRSYITAESLATSRWLLGPDQLKGTESEYTEGTGPLFQLIDESTDRELRPEVSSLKTDVSDSFATRFDRYGSWTNLVGSISYLKRCIAIKKGVDIDLSIRDIESTKEAEKVITRLTQHHYFKTEIDSLLRDKPVARTSPIVSLNPFIDEDGILRLGGRLNESSLPLACKNPILVPGKSHIANLLVLHFHRKTKHQGRFLTEGAIRAAGYWIIGAKRLVSSIINKCVICRALRGRPRNQIMADLPKERVTPSPPFSCVGVDTFGPWSVIARKTRGGQAHSKRWAILFTCLYTRAIHIELVEEMSTPAFVNALRRLVSLRGSVKEFRSDRGTNFIGAIDVLDIDAIFVEQREVRDFLHDSGAVWRFNPPHASHMGGSWERMIGLTRKILDAMLLQSKHLTHDILATFMAEVCAIINSRPITNISSDPDDPMIVCPQMLLTQKCGTDPMPKLSTSIKDAYRSSWKHVQYLADIFWKKWKDGYLNTLQKRNKWPYSTPDIKEGDIVLMCDKDLPRIQWSKGRVIKAIPSSGDKRVRTVELSVIRDGKETKCVRPINELIVLLE